MSRLILNEVAAPSVPAAGKGAIFFDVSDEKVKLLDDQGFTQVLTPDGWRDKNIVLNGDFNWYQRGTHTATATANRLYAADRWGMSIQTSSNTFTQIDTSGAPEVGYEPQYYGKFTQTTGAGKLVLTQVIAHGNMANLRNDKVRIQFSARQSAGTNAVLRIQLVQLTAAGTVDTVTNTSFIAGWGANGVDQTLPANHTAITPDLVDASSGAISGAGITTNSLTSTWTQYSGVFTVPSNAKNLIVMISTHNQLAINDAICIGEVGLYLGQETRIWAPSNDMIELLQCQRYFSKSFPLSVTPAASVALATGGYGDIGMIGKAAATALAGFINVRFPVRMRTTPTTVTLYTPVTTGAQMYRFTNTATVQTATAVVQKFDYGFLASCTGDAAGIIGDQVCLHWTADAEL